MNPTNIIVCVLSVVILVANTPSLIQWVGSFFKRSTQKPSNGQKVRTQHPFDVTDEVTNKEVAFVLSHEATVELFEDIRTQIEKVAP
jgi:hypothetical protein